MVAKGSKQKKKGVPLAPLGRTQDVKVKKNPLTEKRTRNFRIGGDIQPKRDLTRFVKWPQYIRLQRQKRILMQRVKVPPSVAQFSHTADKNTFANVLRLFKKYQPETKAQKQQRLRETAEAKLKGEEVNTACPPTIKYGVNHVTELIEQKKAKFVIIAHDVDPIELVIFLPTLCRKKDIPYMVVKGKSRLGQLVHKKTATCLCLTNVRDADKKDLQTLAESAMNSFNNNIDVRRHWGGGIMGVKSQHVTARRALMLEKELAKKTGLIVN